MKKISLSAVVWIASWLISQNGLGAERPGAYGFLVPYPKGQPEFVMASNLPRYDMERMVIALLDIDDDGKVRAVSAENPRDTSFIRYADVYLKSFRFEPARFDGKKVSSLLPVWLQFRSRVSFVETHFPADSNLEVWDTDLYNKTFVLNDISLPGIKKFPSYSSNLIAATTPVAFPFVLARLDLDEKGHLVSSEKILSTHCTFDEQVISALLWAEFEPAVVKGTPVPTTAFILVSFFPGATYPTVPRDVETDLDLPLFERLGLRLFADTIGLMSKPIPRLAPYDTYSLRRQCRTCRDTVSVRIRVDSLGRASIRRVSKTSAEVITTIRRIMGNVVFFPAVDFGGSVRPFTGLARFEFTGSVAVRISYDWLP